jgi:hypothetical protein
MTLVLGAFAPSVEVAARRSARDWNSELLRVEC